MLVRLRLTVANLQAYLDSRKATGSKRRTVITEPKPRAIG